MRTFLDTVRDTLGSDARFTWVDEEFLMHEKIAPWSEMPLWVPAAEANFNEADFSRALAAGLQLRPVAETIRATLTHEQSLGAEGRAGSPTLTREREVELLAKWRAKS